jgi:hypothetical protein
VRRRLRRRVRSSGYYPGHGPTADSPFSCPPIVSMYPMPREEREAVDAFLRQILVNETQPGREVGEGFLGWLFRERRG